MTTKLAKAEAGTMLTLPEMQEARKHFNSTIKKSLKAVEEMEERVNDDQEDDKGKPKAPDTQGILNLVRAKYVLLQMTQQLNGDAGASVSKGDGIRATGSLANMNGTCIIAQSRVTEKDAKGNITGSRIEETLSHSVPTD